MWFKGNVIGVEVPLVCEYIVQDIGQLLESGVKNAIIGNGVTVQVPEFIGQGEKIRVNTSDGTYVDRGSNTSSS